MKTAIISLVFCLPALCGAQSTALPQGYEAVENIREMSSMQGSGTFRSFDTRYEGVRGTPYVFEEFHPGEVYLRSKERVRVKSLNYNCVDNEIAYLDPATDVTRLLNRFQVDVFTIEDGETQRTFVPVKLEEDGETVFAEALYNRASLVCKVYYKDWLKANYEGSYSADRRYDQFVDKSDLYIFKQGDQTPYKAKRSKKLIREAFPEHEKEISAFVKSNSLNLKEGESLVRLMEYYDSLR